MLGHSPILNHATKSHDSQLHLSRYPMMTTSAMERVGLWGCSPPHFKGVASNLILYHKNIFFPVK